jgi:hypothetical protein
MVGKSVFIQDFNNKVIRNLVLKIKPSETDKKYLGYTLFIYISKDDEVSVSINESIFDVEIQPVDEDLKGAFMESLAEIDISPYRGCLLVYPILFKMRSSNELEDNFREGIKSMMPVVRFESVDCIQFQEPMIVSGWGGV